MDLDVRRPLWASRRLGRGSSHSRRFAFALASFALLLSSLASLAPLPVISPIENASANHTNIKMPVPGGETWTVSQGYNTNPANGGSHYNCNPSTLRDQPSGTVSCSQYWQYKYSFDIVPASGSASGKTVLSPVNGTIRWIDEAYGGMSIDLGDGYAYAFFHVALASGLAAGQTLTQGQFLGTVATPGNGGNGGFSHIHITLWKTTDGGNWSRVAEPFTGNHSLDGISFPAQSDSTTNQYRSSSITSTNSGTTPPSSTVPGVPQLTSPANGTTYTTTPQVVNLAWSAVSGATSYQVVINDGAITSPWVTTTTWTTGSLSSGQYAWQVRSRNSSGQSALSAKLVFWVDPSGGGGAPTPGTTAGPLAVTTQASSGVAGLGTYAIGSGMTANETVEIFWDSTSGTKLGTATANSTGNWVSAITVPESPGGVHKVVAKGKTSTKTANVNFTVKQALIRSPYQAVPGTTIGVTIKGFGASESVNFVFYHTGASTTTVASITTNSAGTASVTFPMPESTAGPHDYKVTGATSGLSAWGELSVQALVTLSATQGAVGTSVTATAKGFAGSSTIRFAWNQTTSAQGTTLCSSTTSAKGSATCTFSVPSASAGAYPVVATTSDGTTGSAQFGLAGAASITLTPSSGTVGAAVQASIGGFQANETVRLTIDGSSAVWQSATANSTGAILLPSTIPFLPQGSHTIQAKGVTSNKTASATLTVQPSMSVTPSGGAAGTSVSAYARGMKANTAISIRFNATSASTGTSVCSGTTDAEGSFSCSFNVPNVNKATYSVYAGTGSTTTTTNYAVTTAGEVTGGIVLGQGTYQITATREGLVGGTTSNGHVITTSDHFVALPACTPANCDWLAPGTTSDRWGYVANCNAATTCFVRVTNPANGECRVEPIWDTGPWFTNDNWWDPAERRNLNNLSSTVNILPQGYTGADAARDGLNVGYGISNGIGVSNVGYQTGNRAAIDIADGTWQDIGFSYGAGPVTVVVTMLWQSGEDVSAARQACLGNVEPPNDDATIAISPSFGEVGESVTVTGASFSAGETVGIYLDSTNSGSPLKTVTASSAGAFSTSITIPTTTTGNHLIAAKGNTSGEKASRTYTVIASPSISIDPTTGPNGTTVTVAGRGYNPNEQIQVYWDSTGSNGTLLKTVTATSLGTFSTTITTPTATTGGHLIVGKGVTSGHKPSRTFTVSAPVAPAISITITSGPGGTVVPITGAGYTPGETVDIRWDRSTGIILKTVTVNSSGAFSTSATVPDASPGKHLFVGVGRTSGAKPSRSFTVTDISQVTPKISISPTSGRTATTVTVTGVGYDPNESVQIYWDSTGSTGTLLETTTATNTGTFSVTISIPHTTGGEHLIVGKGVTSGVKPSRTFTIIQSISLSASSATPGTTVRFTLRGFHAGEPVALTWDNVDGAPLISVTANSTGSASGSFVVPNTINGTHRVVANGGVTAGLTTANLTVSGGSSATAAVSVDPAAAIPGSTIAVDTTNFWAQEEVQIFWDANTAPSGTSTASFEGASTVSLKVPAMPGGSHTITAKGVTSGKTATTTFTVQPNLILTPASGGVGDRIVADVKGWSPGVTATIYFNRSGSTGGTEVCHADGRASGTASCSFIIPSGFAIGTVVPITATGSFGTVRANLTITASTASVASESTPEPSATATATPEASPSAEATETVTTTPTETATAEASETATTEPTEVATEEPTEEPTEVPTEAPTEVPTEEPTEVPTEVPTEIPTEVPTPEPTVAPEPRTVTSYAVSDATTFGARPDEAAPADQSAVLNAGGADSAVAYITFNVEGIGVGTVTDAYLVVTGGGDAAGGSTIYTVPGLWVDEASATYNSLPSQGLAPAIDISGNAAYLPYVGWGEESWINVAGTIYGDGAITFVITGTPDALATLTSRESGVTPRLEITVQD